MIDVYEQIVAITTQMRADGRGRGSGRDLEESGRREIEESGTAITISTWFSVHVE